MHNHSWLVPPCPWVTSEHWRACNTAHRRINHLKRALGTHGGKLSYTEQNMAPFILMWWSMCSLWRDGAENKAAFETSQMLFKLAWGLWQSKLMSKREISATMDFFNLGIKTSRNNKAPNNIVSAQKLQTLWCPCHHSFKIEDHFDFLRRDIFEKL